MPDTNVTAIKISNLRRSKRLLGDLPMVRRGLQAELHHHDLAGGSGEPLRGDSLLLGTGVNIDLSKGWKAKSEWERYSADDQLDRDIFSAEFEFML